MNNLKELFTKNVDINLSSEIENKLIKYAHLLIEWNEKFNLTSITKEDEIYSKHILDSIISVKKINFENKSILDVGSGAGFPGLVIAICFPTSNVTLIDATKKKTIFLESVVNELDLKNVKVIHGRIEDFSNLKNSFDIVTARAVKELRYLLEFTIPFIKIGGEFLAYKGPSFSEELKSASKALNVLNASLKDVITYSLSDEIERKIGVFTKSKETNSKYPRDYSKIISNPL